jgi:hypothetical protein
VIDLSRLFKPAPDESQAIERTYQRRVKAADRKVAKAQETLAKAKAKAKRAAKRRPPTPAAEDWETPNSVSDWE